MNGRSVTDTWAERVACYIEQPGVPGSRVVSLWVERVRIERSRRSSLFCHLLAIPAFVVGFPVVSLMAVIKLARESYWNI